MRRGSSLIWKVLVCVLLAGGSALAQVTTGTILGTVADSTGAVVPGATVTVRNVETGISRTLTTDATGRYRAPQLGLGTYEVAAEVAGFQTVVRSGITLTVGREAVVDFALQVGAVAERITVTGEAPMVETTTSTVSQVMQGQSVRDLPLISRSYDELALLQPGVFMAQQSSNRTGYGQANRFISMAGSRANSNVVLLDGTNVNAFWNRGAGGLDMLGVDAIREYRLITSTFSAEFGRSAGGVMNVVTRNGTNEFHGTVFEYLRNSKLDARNFFDGEEPPPFKRNQFGATLGGPIARDRSFFYGAWEGLRERTSSSERGFVPSLRTRQGFLPRTGGGETNVGVAPVIQPFMALYPIPNGPDQGDGSALYNYTSSQVYNQDFYQIRLDEQLSENHSLFGRFTFSDSDIGTNGTLGIFPATARYRNQYLTLTHTAILSPTVLNTARFGFARNYGGGAVQHSPEILFFGSIPVPGRFQVGGVDILGYGVTDTGFQIVQNLFEYSDDVSISRGRHTMKFGALVGRTRSKYEHYYQVNGEYNFTSLTTLLQARPSSWRGGLPGSDAVGLFQQMQFGFYMQDDMQATSRLTLNMGVRYEFTTNPVNVNVGHNKLIPFVRDHLRSTDFEWAEHPWAKNPSLGSISPRFGFAWDTFGNGRTALRGGFGIVYEPLIQHYYAFALQNPRATDIGFQFNPPFPNAAQIVAKTVTAANLAVSEGIDYNWCCAPQVMQYSLALQQELPGDMGLTLGYLGSRGTHIQTSANVNMPFTKKDANGRYFVPRNPDGSIPPRRNPKFGPIVFDFPAANTLYNSLQFTLQKRQPSAGLTYNLSYTWSKNIDEVSGQQALQSAGGGHNVQNWDDRKGNRSVSSFDRRHVFSLNSRYDFPLGSNRAVPLSGIADRLFGGWHLSNILKMSSGGPININVTFDRVGNYGDAYFLILRPDLAPGFSNNPVVEDYKWDGAGFVQYLDANAYVLQPAGYFGNLGRNAAFGPGNITWDVAVAKEVSFGEGKDLQFRVEFFNNLNRINLAQPFANAFTGPTRRHSRLGQIRNVGDPRKLQLGLKFTF